MAMDIEEIFKIVRVQLGVRTVRAEDHLQADLGAESLDLQSIITAMEDRFGVELSDEELIPVETVGDLHALVSSKV